MSAGTSIGLSDAVAGAGGWMPMSPCACRTRAATSGSRVPAGGPDAGDGEATGDGEASAVDSAELSDAAAGDGEAAVSDVDAGAGASSPQAANAPGAAPPSAAVSSRRRVKWNGVFMRNQWPEPMA